MPKPKWNPNSKEESLELYASWLNELARMAFLENGAYPESFFFITDDGEILACLLPENISKEQREDVLHRQNSEINPFGTIQIIVKHVYYSKLFNQYLVRECLLTKLINKGKEKIWANFVTRNGENVSLEDCRVSQPEILM